MFQFENIEYLYGLLLLPLLLLFLLWVVRDNRKRREKLGQWSSIAKQVPNLAPKRTYWKFALVLLAFVGLIVAYANPRLGSKTQRVQRKSLDVFIALDVSRSMNATDLQPNRMLRARRFVRDLIDGLVGERIGLVLFAGNAYLQMPLTTDYAAAKMLIQTAGPDVAPTQGTAIGAAIQLTQQTFQNNEDDNRRRVLVVVTDGENHEGGALEAAEEAAENGLVIFTVGVGTEEGARIPTANGFVLDKMGREVETKLNPEMLRDVAVAGKGAYYQMRDGEAVISNIKRQIAQFEKQTYEENTFDRFETRFQWWLGPALLFLILEALLAFRRKAKGWL